MVKRGHSALSYSACLLFSQDFVKSLYTLLTCWRMLEIQLTITL